MKSLTKAIEAGSRTKISVELKKNHTIQFVIIGGRNSVDKASKEVKYEFEKVPKVLFSFRLITYNLIIIGITAALQSREGISS